MKVAQTENGLWGVFKDDGTPIAIGLTSQGAWRELDKLSGEALNKAEDTAAWVFKRSAGEPWT